MTIRKTTTATNLRTEHRDARIAAIERRLNVRTRAIYQAVLGAVAAHQARPDVAAHEARGIIVREWPELGAAIDFGLRSMIDWSYTTGASTILNAVPVYAWLRRYERATEGRILEKQAPVFRSKNRIADLLKGKLSKDQAKDLIRNLEFPPPTEQKVRQILTDTTAPDGLSWEHRIKTVPQADLDRLLGTITREFSQGGDISAIQKPLEAFFSAENYKARRIARTEGVRVAEAGLRESWQQVGDMVGAIQTWTAGDANVRDSHEHWHGKIFKRQSDGTYVAADGERLPTFPAAPNCRCWSSPILDFGDEEQPTPDLAGVL